MTNKNSTEISPVTEHEKASWRAHGVVKLEKPFVDVRGKIQPLVDEMMRSAVMIDSKAGSIRANHYHKTDWHYCYVLSGTIEYLHRPTGSDAEPEIILVNEGEMVFTPPMIDHGMKFPVDTVFLTLSRNPRDQATYEADVVRVDFVPTDGLKSWTPEDDNA
jgi:quercetin dioxygenase-like cupin family protein